MIHHRDNATVPLPAYAASRRLLAAAMIVAVAIGALATPVAALAEDDPAPTPAALTQLLSCQSRDALGTFGDLLFLENRSPAWMRPSKLPKALDGMIGVYGFAVEGSVAVFGEPVDHVYFMGDWVVALLPRARAERIIREQTLKRAPIALTEQYYRFVDPKVGPMIGGFAPTGDAMANALIAAFGHDATHGPSPAPPSSTPDMLLVGCNYAVASQEDFLAVARGAEDIMHKAGADIRRMADEGEARPAR